MFTLSWPGELNVSDQQFSHFVAHLPTINDQSLKHTFYQLQLPVTAVSQDFRKHFAAMAIKHCSLPVQAKREQYRPPDCIGTFHGHLDTGMWGHNPVI